MITTAALLFSVQFLLADGFRKSAGSNLNASLRFMLYSSITGGVLCFIINNCRVDVTLFSVIMATLLSAVGVLSGWLSLEALHHANLSVFSIFTMIGGMLLPFIYGAATNEDLSIMTYISCIIIMLAVILPADRGKQSKKGLFFCFGIFFANGVVSILSTIHQRYPNLCVDSESFSVLTKVITFLMCAVIIFFTKEQKFKVSLKEFLCCTGHGICNGIGSLLSLIALLHLYASVQYPILTGGTIIFAVLIDFLRKERITIKVALSAVLALIGTILIGM